jgi:hypothetical protein
MSSNSKTLWLQAEQKQEAQRVANIELRQARIKYWQAGDTCLWILSDIGKERPITFAVVTRAQKLNVWKSWYSAKRGAMKFDFLLIPLNLLIKPSRTTASYLVTLMVFLAQPIQLEQ